MTTPKPTTDPLSVLRPVVRLPPRPRLLIVDDQPINIQSLYSIFQADHEVFMATGGLKALAFCQSQPAPDLILLDVMMPDLDGLEVCRRLKADPMLADIPVIFITAQSDPMDETSALEAGGVDFISKPVNPAAVRARVKTHLTLKAQSDLLRSLVFLDGLTGVANRRRFDETLENEWRRCQRSRSSLALIMIDIDHFKRYNDCYGHQAGDACLQRVGALLKEAFGRPHDLVARYGGEEFACLMPECGQEGAAVKAEELRASITRLALPHEDSPTAPFVTLSLGLAACVPKSAIKPACLIAAADAALYEAKKTGRNRVASAPEEAVFTACLPPAQ
jgi:diguanylate cyclase (GGDEF)-like protein